MRQRKSLYVAFVVSGIAGLVYEVLWTRYLALYVGHGAYAQILVLAVYLGGMALGSMIVADLSDRVSSPFAWYGVAETALAVFGFVFHPVYVAVTDFSYDTLFPAVGSAQLVGSLRWVVAGVLILPQAMILGATFPLMAAGMVRSDRGHPGRAIARVYLLNTLGGAAGVLLGGFWMIGALGLPGTSMGAGVLNLVAAGLAFRAASARLDSAPATAAVESTDEPPLLPWGVSAKPVLWVLLIVSFGTALASFAYEIAWTRMLSLVLGSATHSFELMLSAFILGLALGAWWIRGRSDETATPLRLLGDIQLLMGLAAVASVPLFYVVSFDAISWLVVNLRGEDGGYALFNLSRYGLCLLVMLPATVLAGMTLPVITGTLLRAGAGEAAIGRVYGINTVGSVAGAALSGLIALPFLGLKGLVLAGAGLDVVLGLVLLERSARWSETGLRRAAVGVVVAGTLFAAVGFGLDFDEIVLTSGPYRQGIVAGEGDRVSLFYGDGRTATVSAFMGTSDGLISLSTNGKPDASLDQRWLAERRDTLPDTPIASGRDYTTQVLAPAVALAMNPEARSVANIGHGSGMTATSFLTSPEVERIVTIEIEPLMLEGSFVFLPANGPAIADPRASYVFDDAKSYLAYHRERFDIVFSEPSNPWVSGTASLFTEEFYERAASFLTDRGVLAQWVQLYELNDDLFLSVVAALDHVFPSYRAYLVGDADVAIVAGKSPLPEPDWSVLQSEGFLAMTESAPPFHQQHMESLLLFDETTLRPLLDAGVEPNSDFRPILDLGSERTRFLQTLASGSFGLATSRVDLPHILGGQTVDPMPYVPVPARGLAPAVAWGRAAWLRDALAAGGGIAPEHFPDWQNTLVDLQVFLELSGADRLVGTWPEWTRRFATTESSLHWGTVGWLDTTFYHTVDDFLERANAPAEARAVVDLRRGLSLLDWEQAANAADLLVPRVQAGEAWEAPALLLDVAVLAYLRTGRPTAARNAFTSLAPLTRRPPWHLRNRLLDAMIREAERDTAPPS